MGGKRIQENTIQVFNKGEVMARAMTKTIDDTAGSKSDYQFQIGDIVTHRASGKLGIVVSYVEGGDDWEPEFPYEVSTDFGDLFHAKEVELGLYMSIHAE